MCVVDDVTKKEIKKLCAANNYALCILNYALIRCLRI